MVAKRNPNKLTGWPTNLKTMMFKWLDRSPKTGEQGFYIMDTNAML
jgi:hypothetical protein